MGRRGRVTALPWTGLTLTAALLASGCSGTAAEADHSHEVPDLPPPGAATSIVLPLDDYVISPEEQERADRAQAALEVSCLSRFGLTWSGPADSDLLVGRAILAAGLAERFGLVDEAQAVAHGYHPPRWSTRTLIASREHAHHHEPPADVAEVLFGQVSTIDGDSVPAEGCRGEASRQLSANTRPLATTSLVTRLEEEAAREAATDDRVTAMFDAWSACMAEAGYHYSTPMSAARDQQWRRAPKPSPQEVAVAGTDVACKTAVGYLDTLVDATAESQRTLIESHVDELDRVKQSLTVGAHNVTMALSSHVPSDPGR